MRLRATENTTILFAWLFVLLATSYMALNSSAPSPLGELVEWWASNDVRNWEWGFSLAPICLIALVNVPRSNTILVTSAALLVSIVAVIWTRTAGGDWGAAVYFAIKISAVYGLCVLLTQVHAENGLERLLIALMITTYLALDTFSLSFTYLASA